MGALWKVFGSWRMAIVLLTGFSAGIPLGLTGSTLRAWMATDHVDITMIGIFSLVGLPYTFKFLWSPVMDRFIPPFLGRRRGWMVVCQIALIMTIAAMAFSNPVTAPGVLALISLLVAFCSASQDIVVDAYRTEVLSPEEYGAGAGVYILGYRIAMIVSSALALVLADHMSWRAVYLVMAATLLVGIVASVSAPEPAKQTKSPKTLSEAVIQPFLEYFRRRGALEMLVFILIYKLDVAIATVMTTPFMMELGFSKTDIGVVSNGFGLAATIVGALAGGAVMTKIGIKRSLWIFGILQGVSGFSFMTLARLGHHYPMMVTAIAVENFCSGLGTAAFTAFIMSLCDKRFTATQYALLTSLMAVSRVVAGAPTGYMIKSLGWEKFFLVSILIAIPGLLLLLRYDSWTKLNRENEEADPGVTPEPAR